MPTHRYKKYERNRKWLIDTVILKPNESEFFKKKTVIDLKNIFFVKENEFLKTVQNGKLVYKSILGKDIINAETLSSKDIMRLFVRNRLTFALLSTSETEYIWG